MTTTRFVLLGALALGLAGSASAATKTNLTATNNTIAGPGAVTIVAGGSEQVFSHPTGSDVCVTVSNTGKESIVVDLDGVSSATPSVPSGSTKGICSDDTTAISLTCGEEGSSCTAQWRVDDN